VLLFDKRGTGLSDAVRDLTSLEARMDDVRAVMDAAESSHAILVAFNEGARLALLFAATYPERVDALVLGDPYVRLMRSSEHPWGGRPEDVRARVEGASRHWGERSFCRELFHGAYPDATYDEEMEEWWVWHVRRGASPGAAAAWYRGVWGADVTDVLASVRVPVVVVRFLIPQGEFAISPTVSPTRASSTRPARLSRSPEWAWNMCWLRSRGLPLAARRLHLIAS
jgi:pimeloyl-ACP methyl ester carboxylesterase